MPTDSPRPVGIECRRCGCRHFHVVECVPLSNGMVRWRRACRHCGWRLVTLERPTKDTPLDIQNSKR